MRDSVEEGPDMMAEDASRKRDAAAEAAVVARALEQLGARRYGDALATLRPALSKWPGSLKIRMAAATALQRSGDANCALSMLRSIGKLLNSQFMMLLARTQWDRGASRQSSDAYRWAAVLDPGSSAALQGVTATSHAAAPADELDLGLMKAAAVLGRNPDPEKRRALETEMTELGAIAFWEHSQPEAAIRVLERHGAAGRQHLEILMRGVVYAYAATNPDLVVPFWNSNDLLNAALFAGRGTTILDIGMRQGVVADMHLGWGASQVHGFEPEPGAAASLRETFAKDKGTTIHEIALSDTPGSAMLLVPAATPGAATLDRAFANIIRSSRDTEWLEVPVEVCRLDDLDLPHFSFIKIDVEGLENLLISGATQTLNRSKPFGLQVEVFFRRDGTWRHTVSLLKHHFRHVWVIGATPEGQPRCFDLPPPSGGEAALHVALQQVSTPIVTASDRSIDEWIREVDLRALLQMRLSRLAEGSSDGLADRFRHLVRRLRMDQDAPSV